MSSSFQVLYLPYVASTQEIAKNILQENVVVVADSQNKGRGRFKRIWYSPPGGLWCTIILKTDLEPQIVSLLIGVVITKALKNLDFHTCLKWPNDILFKGKKLGGVLGELYNGYLLVGIGINLQNEIPEEISDIAINIPSISRDELLYNILEILEENIEKDKSEIIMEWKKYNCTLGKKVRIIEDTTYEGVAMDITDDGFLLVKSEKGVKKVIAGDVIILE